MDGNKDEAERCIQLAEKYIKEKNREKAEKFLHKAERLFPTQKAKGKYSALNGRQLCQFIYYIYIQISWCKSA